MAIMKVINKECSKENLNNNMYYIAYNILADAIKSFDIYNGLNKSLEIIKKSLKCSNVFLFKSTKNHDYINYNSHIKNKNLSILIKNNKKLIEHEKILNMEYLDNKNLNKVTFIYIKEKNTKYIIALVNLPKEFNTYNSRYLDIIKDTICIILKKIDQVEHIKKLSTTDRLTGLKNRDSYESYIKKLNKSNKQFYYILFDLFRLKYVNDNFSHDHGDRYIIEVAKILSKYFPTSNIYRIGGDEFVLITKSQNIEKIESTLKLIKEEVQAIVLDANNHIPLFINYGVSHHKNNETIRDLYIIADKLLQQDKKRLYKKLGIERRK